MINPKERGKMSRKKRKSRKPPKRTIRTVGGRRKKATKCHQPKQVPQERPRKRKKNTGAGRKKPGPAQTEATGKGKKNTLNRRRCKGGENERRIKARKKGYSLPGQLPNPVIKEKRKNRLKTGKGKECEESWKKGKE